VGAHVTVRLPAKLDISGVVSVNGGFEGILQRRLLFTEYVGLSAGISFRAEQHSFYVTSHYPDEPLSERGWTPNESLVSHSIGDRANGILYERSKVSPILRALVFAVYSNTLESRVLRFGITVGAF